MAPFTKRYVEQRSNNEIELHFQTLKLQVENKKLSQKAFNFKSVLRPDDAKWNDDLQKCLQIKFTITISMQNAQFYDPTFKTFLKIRYKERYVNIYCTIHPVTIWREKNSAPAG